MPPKRGKAKGKKGKGGKKKKGKGLKKKKGKKLEARELTVKDMYLRSVKEIARLKEEVAVHATEARRARTACAVARGDRNNTQEFLEQEQETKKDIVSDLTRQYKNMQMQMGMRMQQQEGQLHQLQQELGQARQDLAKVSEERDCYRRSTEDLEEQLRTIVERLEQSYETILLDTMDTMTSRVEELRLDWAQDAASTDRHLVQLCSEFGGRYIAGADRDTRRRSLYQ